MTTWLADFQEKTELNRYPVALRTRGGIGYRVGNQVVSNFVGHPIHYLSGKEWKPITLLHDKGQFEGCDFGWNGYAVTHKKKVLFTPESITFNKVIRPLSFFLDADNHRLVAYVPGIGEYEILFTERGVREILTIPEPLEGTLTFQVSHEKKPDELFKAERKIVTDALDLSAKQTGDEYALTREMKYPLVIDPDYAGVTADGYVYGNNATYSTARSTSSASSVSTTISVGQFLGFYVYRGFLKFDTSGIPDGDSLSQVNLKLTCTTDGSTTDFDIVIRKHDWSGQDPIAAENQEAAYDGCLAATSDSSIWRNTSGMSTNTAYSSGNLDVTWPSKTVYTYYSLLSKEDVDNSVPGGAEFIYIGAQENVTAAYRPVLTVVHAAPASAFHGLALLGVGK